MIVRTFALGVCMLVTAGDAIAQVKSDGTPVVGGAPDVDPGLKKWFRELWVQATNPGLRPEMFVSYKWWLIPSLPATEEAALRERAAKYPESKAASRIAQWDDLASRTDKPSIMHVWNGRDRWRESQDYWDGTGSDIAVTTETTWCRGGPQLATIDRRRPPPQLRDYAAMGPSTRSKAAAFITGGLSIATWEQVWQPPLLEMAGPSEWSAAATLLDGSGAVGPRTLVATGTWDPIARAGSIAEIRVESPESKEPVSVLRISDWEQVTPDIRAARSISWHRRSAEDRFELVTLRPADPKEVDRICGTPKPGSPDPFRGALTLTSLVEYVDGTEVVSELSPTGAVVAQVIGEDATTTAGRLTRYGWWTLAALLAIMAGWWLRTRGNT